MFNSKWKLAFILIIIAGLSYWLLSKLTGDDNQALAKLAHYPDYYMENFTTLKMNQDGTPKNHLSASYMAHYPDDNTTELDYPKLKIFVKNKLPTNVSADKGWVTSGNEVILLIGNVHLYQVDDSGEMNLELITKDARVLVDKKYAETDKPATLISKNSVTNSTGMRIHLQEERMEFLNNVQTTIESSQKN
jgi:lipopolysaccharide export system protein LptC